MNIGRAAVENLTHWRAVDEMRHASRERAFAAARWARDEVGMRESAPTVGAAQIIQRNFRRESHAFRNAGAGPLESSGRDNRTEPKLHSRSPLRFVQSTPWHR